MTLLSYVCIPVYDNITGVYTSIIKVPVDHAFVDLKIVTTQDVLEHNIQNMKV